MKAIINAICCLTTTAIKVEQTAKSTNQCYETSICCLPVKCCVELINMCTSDVTPTNDNVEMTGAEAPHPATMV
jgi:hypothetical protein